RAKNKPAEDAISAFIGRPTTPETIGTDFLQAFWLQETGQMPNPSQAIPRDPNIPRDSVTGNLAKELFPVIALAQQTGNFTPETKATMEETLQGYINSDRFDITYEIGFFNVVSSSKENTVRYLSSFNSLLQVFKKTPDPIFSIEQAISTENGNVLEEVRPILEAYQSLETKLLAMPVPTDALYLHMSVTNATASMRINLENLTRIKDDPVLAMAGLTRYKSDFTLLDQTLQEIVAYFINPKKLDYNL
ncbi:MAG: hypothetical protein K9M36_03585, partial [Candidatus Pacebacteria bacterium]|nr:hypothetical protein [Candidatus Paceibacterota bacterium]